MQTQQPNSPTASIYGKPSVTFEISGDTWRIFEPGDDEIALQEDGETRTSAAALVAILWRERAIVAFPGADWASIGDAVGTIANAGPQGSTAEQPPPAEQPSPAGFNLYEAYSGPSLDFWGYVLSEGAGLAERIVAVTPNVVAEESSDRAEFMAEDLAALRAFAANPNTRNRQILSFILDWRDKGRLDSTQPMPPEAYAWSLAPIGGGPGKADHHVWPFCPLRFRDMLQQYAHLAFSDEARRDFPDVRVALASAPEGDDDDSHEATSRIVIEGLG